MALAIPTMSADQGAKYGPGTSLICLGINESNWQPCRNIVAASRAFQYCHLHQAQAQVKVGNTNDVPRQSSGRTRSPKKNLGTDHGGSRHSSSVPALQVLKAATVPKTALAQGTVGSRQGLPAVSVDLEQQKKMPEREDGRHPTQRNSMSEARDKGTSLARLTSEVSNLKLQSSTTAASSERLSRMTRANTEQDLSKSGTAAALRPFMTTSDEPTQHDKRNKFSVKRFLVAMVSNQSTDQDLPHSQIQRSTSTRKTAVSSLPDSKLNEGSGSRRVPRKPVDHRPVAQIVQESKIKKDRAEIERLLRSQSVPQPIPGPERETKPMIPHTVHDRIDMVGKVRSDLQPFCAPENIRYRMTRIQQDAYFLSRYANPLDYPHKANKSMARMQEVIRSVVNGALLASYSETDRQVWEYLYVFRLDGDYHNTPRISVKIGRSKDVNARLKQWFAQCRYRIDKLEQFETPYAVLMERMMHLEFEEDRVLKQCRCGTVHREWFDIRREDARGRIKRAFIKWTSFADEIQALRSSSDGRQVS